MTVSVFVHRPLCIMTGMLAPDLRRSWAAPARIEWRKKQEVIDIPVKLAPKNIKR